MNELQSLEEGQVVEWVDENGGRWPAKIEKVITNNIVISQEQRNGSRRRFHWGAEDSQWRAGCMRLAPVQVKAGASSRGFTVFSHVPEVDIAALRKHWVDRDYRGTRDILDLCHAVEARDARITELERVVEARDIIETKQAAEIDRLRGEVNRQAIVAGDAHADDVCALGARIAELEKQLELSRATAQASDETAVSLRTSVEHLQRRVRESGQRALGAAALARADRVIGCVKCACPCALVGDDIPRDGLCASCRGAASTEALAAKDARIAELRAALDGMLRCICFGASPSGANLEQANQLVADPDAAAKRFVDVDSEEMRRLLVDAFERGATDHDTDTSSNAVPNIIATFKTRRGIK